jgi:hypothetical protein
LSITSFISGMTLEREHPRVPTRKRITKTNPIALNRYLLIIHLPIKKAARGYALIAASS